MYLLGLLFRVQEHEVMVCALVLYSSCFKCFLAQFINQFCSA